MNMKMDLSETMLNEKQQEAVRSFCEAITSLPDNHLKSVVLYGSAVRKDYRSGLSDINLLIILERADMKALKNLVEPVTIGRAAGIAPLFLSTADLTKAVAAFPLKFLSIRESHQALYGDNLLATIEFKKEPLDLRCRQEMMNLLMRLRRQYLNSMGHNLAGFMAASIKGFLECLRMILYLKNDKLPAREDTLDMAAKALGTDMSVVRDIVSIKDRQEIPGNDVVQEIYERYLKLVEQIVYKM